MDKVGKLDEIENRGKDFNCNPSFYLEIGLGLISGKSTFWVGASNSKPELVAYYKHTNQVLAKYEFQHTISFSIIYSNTVFRSYCF
jgi:hypothetical protein